MSKEHIAPISNGKGFKELLSGSYSVTANVEGYDNTTIDPKSITITDNVNEYSLKIASNGTLTLHVSDDGTSIGIPIVGATFYRCDSTGVTYGDPIVTDSEGNATFNNVPFSTYKSGPTIYFKQTTSDGEHLFDNSLQEETLDAETKLIEIENTDATTRNFSLTDSNYDGLPIDGNITLTE